MSLLPLTPEQHRDLYDLLAYVLRSKRAQEGSSLVEVRDWLKEHAAEAFCSNCLAEEVFARGRCQPCYRYERRTGRERPPELSSRKSA